MQEHTQILEEEKWQIAETAESKIYKPLRFGVELVPSKKIEKLLSFGTTLEAGGIDNIWITDHYTNMDPYVLLTLMAKATKSATLGIGVTNPFTRHIAATASAVSSLDIVSNHRMILGLGAGDTPTIASLNLKTENIIKTISETVQAIRLLWVEKIVNFNGEVIQLKNARLNFKPEARIPIYIGAQGPKMLQLAGEIGDGVLINASDELDFKIARKLINEGAHKGNKRISDLDIVAYTCFSTDPIFPVALNNRFCTFLYSNF